jgi:hypothetical protein
MVRRRVGRPLCTEQSYRQRFGAAAPARIATLGYDSVLLSASGAHVEAGHPVPDRAPL